MEVRSINRDTPEMYKMEVDEGEELIPLRQFYTEDCNVRFIESKDAEHILALDFDDPSIMIQDKTDLEETYRMNLLYAREHFKKAYHMWYYHRENFKMKQ